MESGRGSTTVLIVEDEKPIADVYEEILEDEYRVRVAYTGDEAIGQMDETVDVVLLDRRLPGKDGDTVLEEIQNEGYDCYVAMVTAVDPGFDIVNMGFDDYVVKPLSPSELKETVQRLEQLESYDETYQELSSKRVKRNVLVMEKTEDQLEENEEYQRLNEEIEQLETQLEAIEEALEDSAVKPERRR